MLATALAAPLPARAQFAKIRNIKFPGAGGIELGGTLMLPGIAEAKPVPGVVLIAGSGPTDRDGNNPGIPEKVDLLMQIAVLLANAGIASLRYDKRGIGQSTKSPNSVAGAEAFFAWENLIGDVQLAHAELIKQSGVKSYATALLGHSEGGLFAIAAAALTIRQPPYALVLAGTPGLKLQDLIRNQFARTAPALVSQAEKIMNDIRRTGHAPTGLPPDLAAVFPPYIGPFLKGELAFDPAATLAKLTQPCLLLQGGADRQVIPMAEIQPLVDALAGRSARGEVVVAPQVSHNLKLMRGPDDPGFAGPLATAIADKLSSWLASTLGA